MILPYRAKGMTSKAALEDQLRLTFSSENWRFSQDNHVSISENWASEKMKRPSLFNGEVLIAQPIRSSDGNFFIQLFSSDYASLRYWQKMPGVDEFRLPFGLPALRTLDGYFVMGRMSSKTANSGMVYFPSGTLSGEDLIGSDADCFSRSVMRELKEETGLENRDVSLGHRWLVIETRKSLACFVDAKLRFSRDELLERFSGFRQTQGADAELEELVFVKQDKDLISLDTPIAQKRFFDMIFQKRVPDCFFFT